MTGKEPIKPLRLGTRGSLLAKWQAQWVASALEKLGHKVELVLMATQGDVRSGPLGTFGGEGVFTKELQQALLQDVIDLAVHSLKDLPTQAVPGLSLAAVPQREPSFDVLVCNTHRQLADLPQGAHVGTGSIRRRAQLLHYRPDLRIDDIRGNLDTRLRKLDEGQYDALILAEAGLRRLGWQQRIAQVIATDIMLPAVGQGALGIETRSDALRVREALAPLNDPDAHCAVRAERALLAALRAGCLAPVGAWARVPADAPHSLLLEAVVLSADGQKRLAVTATGSGDEAEAVGTKAAERLLEQGAASLIEAAHQ